MQKFTTGKPVDFSMHYQEPYNFKKVILEMKLHYRNPAKEIPCITVRSIEMKINLEFH